MPRKSSVGIAEAQKRWNEQSKMGYNVAPSGSGPRGLGTPAQEKMASAQKPRGGKGDQTRAQNERDFQSQVKSGYSRAASDSPSTPWSTSGRKNRLGG